MNYLGPPRMRSCWKRDASCARVNWSGCVGIRSRGGYLIMSPPVPDLNGEWIGHYPGHFDEVIRIMHERDHVLAVKLTGDEHVPAGNVTWWANVQTGDGEGQIAEQEYRNPRFVPG